MRVEHVLFFFISREKILCEYDDYDYYEVEKKRFENTLFEIRKHGKNPPFRTIIIIYNIYI